MDAKKYCADCEEPIGYNNGPPDGWQLEDGRTVCHKCCAIDVWNIFLESERKIWKKILKKQLSKS